MTTTDSDSDYVEQHDRKFLCHRCQSFEGSLVRGLSETSHFQTVWDIGFVGPFPGKDACRLCQMFLDVSPRDNHETFQVLKLQELQDENLADSQQYQPWVESTFILASVDAESNNLNHGTGQVGFIELLLHDGKRVHERCVRRVRQKRADFSVARAWLSDCRQHVACQQPGPITPYFWKAQYGYNLRFIDCKNGRRSPELCLGIGSSFTSQAATESCELGFGTSCCARCCMRHSQAWSAVPLGR